jgi:hypothetical protein
MMRSTLTKGLSWAGAIAGTSALALSLTGGTAFAAGASAHATWTGKLASGTVVSVAGKGWVPGDTLVVSECNPNLNEGACDVSTTQEVTASAKGKLPKGTTLTWTTGTVGNGTCNKKQTCYIVVADLTQIEGGNPTPDQVDIPVVTGKTDS